MAPREGFDPNDVARGLAGSAASESGEREFWAARRHYAPGALVVQTTGAPLVGSIVSGWGCEARMLTNRRRQIFAFRLPGDLIVLPPTEDGADKVVLAVSRLELVRADPKRQDSGARSASDLLGKVLADQNKRLFDQIIRLGALSANARAAHLLLELHDRLSRARLATNGAFRVPLTQDIFANALGLSVVHMNRTLQFLRREQLITLRSGSVTLHDIPRLKDIAQI